MSQRLKYLLYALAANAAMFGIPYVCARFHMSPVTTALVGAVCGAALVGYFYYLVWISPIKPKTEPDTPKIVWYGLLIGFAVICLPLLSDAWHRAPYFQQHSRYIVTAMFFAPSLAIGGCLAGILAIWRGVQREPSGSNVR